MSATPAARSGLTRLAAVAFLVFAATALGGWRVAAMTAPQPDLKTLQVAGASYTVTSVEQVAGLTDADLGGMSHGVQSLVTNENTLVRVTLTVSAGDSGTPYDARSLRAVTNKGGAVVAPVGGSLSHGKLQAHGRIEGTLSFVVKRNGHQISLRTGQSARQIPLLQVDQAPGGGGGHDHSETGPLRGGTSPPSQP